MADLIAGSYMAFAQQGSGEEIASANVLVEVTDSGKSGDVELAFDVTTLKGSPRIYLRVSLPEIVAKTMKIYGTEDT